MRDDVLDRLNESANSTKDLGMDQRRVSPQMQAAIDRGRAAMKTVFASTSTGKKVGGFKLKAASARRK